MKTGPLFAQVHNRHLLDGLESLAVRRRSVLPLIVVADSSSQRQMIQVSRCFLLGVGARRALMVMRAVVRRAARSPRD